MHKLHEIIKQFVKFGIVGITNTIVSLVIYYMFIYINMRLYIAGSICGFIVGVLNSYYWNNRFVFKSDYRNHIKAIVKTFMSYGFTFLLSTILLIIMVEFLHVSEIFAPLFNLIITVPLNFLLNKFWAFKD